MKHVHVIHHKVGKDNALVVVNMDISWIRKDVKQVHVTHHEVCAISYYKAVLSMPHVCSDLQGISTFY